MQEMRAKQESIEKAHHAKIDELQKVVKSQSRTLETLQAFSDENVRKPTCGEAAQAGTVQPKASQKVITSPSLKASSTKASKGAVTALSVNQFAPRR
jgi:hypothetical protein